MYRLLPFSGYVEEVSTEMTVMVSGDSWQAAAYREWVAAGNSPLPVKPPYEPGTPAHHRAIRDAAWAWMTSVVQARDYDTIESCVGYFNSGVERYRLEARAMVAWRDAVNEKLVALVMDPPAGVETWEQVRPLLPQPSLFNWPSSVELPLGIDDGPAVEL
ncbi:hypothetical protein CEK00_04695 [Stenotrophomonas maltophilia]|uniref:Uncharacterized protein n=1 Tax=Stenotrophomonas maltophilia TaxID=40324 RepID=A0A270NM12_STEMA|nr:hypothetical protein [Stenotrophomonas maltophilia]PAM73149.1 hypothetical protein CEK00_04695 [Stenotrophomonas maltophilia]